MATVLDMSVSLDGYAVGRNEGPGNGLGDGGMRLHEWAFEEMPDDTPQTAVLRPGVNGEVMEEMLRTGAVVAGRTTWEMADHWGGDHHDGVPIFIVTRSRPEGRSEEWPLVSFVADVGRALALAQEAAGERDVMFHGIELARLALAAGALDEIQLHQAPVLLGGGRRLFDGVDPAPKLEPARLQMGEGGFAHLRYRVSR